MKLSFDWLSDYVDLEGLTPEHVAEKLTMGAFEVEEVRQVGSAISGPVVVGEIMEIYQHPNADKIRLTKTRVADGAEPLEIACGAGNIEVGQRIPVALPGAKVLNRKDGSVFEIQATAKRGVVSHGMLCSPSELGVSTDGEGILILPAETKLGTDILKMFDLKPDYILHVEPRSNRGDALSVVGLAREVAALCDRPLKQPDWKLSVEESDELSIKVSVENEEDCPFLSIRNIEGLKVGPSPSWIAKRLEAVGVRSISNMVDITNYVMHEYGQPLHAYDLHKLKGGEISARRARDGEKVKTLDGADRELTSEVLVIADGAGSVGLAGIRGGEDSEISDATTAVALEAASFGPARVRRGSRLLGASTDASLRFERGVDPVGSPTASDRATYLLVTLCADPAKKVRISKLQSAGNGQAKTQNVSLRMSQLKRFLGVDFNSNEVLRLLEPLGYKQVESSQESVTVSVPSFRQGDVTREIDLVEEVCRIWGYEKLPVKMPTSTIAATPPDDTMRRVRQLLVGLGFSEAWLSSLVAADEHTPHKEYAAQDVDRLLRVLNPLSEEHQVLRQSLLPGLLKATAYNQDRGRKNVWLFETGRTYHLQAAGGNKGQQEKSEKSSNNGAKQSRASTGVVEEHRIAAVLMGTRALSTWDRQSVGKNSAGESVDFFTAKGVVENLFERLGIDFTKTRFFRPKDIPAHLHPSRSCLVAFDRSRAPKETIDINSPAIVSLGWVGQLHPGLADASGLKNDVYLFELSLDSLKTLRQKSTFSEVPSTPLVQRDLTVDVSAAIDHAAVHSCIVASAGGTLQNAELVSIYQPAEGQKSLSFRLNFQDNEKTLTNEEVENSLGRVREKLGKSLSASFRA